MKTKLTLLAIIGSLMVAALALQAQTIVTNANANTNAVAFIQTPKYLVSVESDRALGERAVLPPGLKEMMKLTNAQRTEIRPIEEEFAITSQKYQMDNQPRIEAAQEASRKARASKDKAEIQSARTRLQDVWVGLQSSRMAAVDQIKRLLTPVQLKILEDPKNQWRENHLDEVNDPSSN